MKNGNPCPKCGLNEIARIPHQATEGTDHGKVALSGLGTIRLDRFICLNCGFFEEWVDSKYGIDQLRRFKVR